MAGGKQQQKKPRGRPPKSNSNMITKNIIRKVNQSDDENQFTPSNTNSEELVEVQIIQSQASASTIRRDLMGSISNLRIEDQGSDFVNPAKTPILAQNLEGKNKAVDLQVESAKSSILAQLPKGDSMAVMSKGETSKGPSVVRVQAEKVAPGGNQIVDNKEWITSLTGNRSASNGMQLRYIVPNLIDGSTVVELDKQEVINETSRWKSALIAYVIGDLPGYNVMLSFVKQIWNEVSEPEVLLHEDGYYIIRFKNMEEMNKVFASGPYSIYNRPVILKHWTPDFDINKEFLTEVPSWIRFPKLPLCYWSCDSLSRIASAIGIPMFTDECTSKQTRISYARMLIEVNVTKQLPSEVVVMDPVGGTFKQAVEYDWAPSYCAKCCKVGHQCQQTDDNQVFEQPRRRRRVNSARNVVKKWEKTGKVYTREELEQHDVVENQGEIETGSTREQLGTEEQLDFEEQRKNNQDDDSGKEVPGKGVSTVKLGPSMIAHIGLKSSGKTDALSPKSYLEVASEGIAVQTQNGFAVLQRHHQMEPVIRPFDAGGKTV